MLNTVNTVLVTLLILFGFILITRKKFMINLLYFNMPWMFIMTISGIIEYTESGYWLSYLYICILPFIVLMIMVSIERYIITNVNAKIIVSIITTFLDERDISYEHEENSLKLKNYDDKVIGYEQSLDTVQIKLIDIKDLPFYKELKEELKYGIKKSNLVLFPSTGLSFIIFGVVFITILQYL